VHLTHLLLFNGRRTSALDTAASVEHGVLVHKTQLLLFNGRCGSALDTGAFV